MYEEILIVYDTNFIFRFLSLTHHSKKKFFCSKSSHCSQIRIRTRLLKNEILTKKNIGRDENEDEDERNEEEKDF